MAKKDSKGDRRGSDRLPIRLKIQYKSADSLLSEFTRSISFGGISLETEKNNVEQGTEFHFEMYAPGVEAPVQVLGEVVHVTEAEAGRFTVGIRYTFDDRQNRETLQRLVSQIMDRYEWNYVRRQPRIPLRIRVKDEDEATPSYLMRDLSLGGTQISMPSGAVLRGDVEVGTPVHLEFPDDAGTLICADGRVVWINRPEGQSRSDAPAAAFGIKFERLSAPAQIAIQRVMKLEHLPEMLHMAIVPSDGEGNDT